MTTEKIRLNKTKRQALKSEWKHVVFNNMHRQTDEELRQAQENYREIRSDVWDGVITPHVEKNYPIADMRVLQRYSGNSHYNMFTTTDRCFYFKPSFNDNSESQFTWQISDDEFLALYHYDLLNRKHEPTIRIEYEQTQRKDNPHFYEAVNNMRDNYSTVAKANGTFEDFALYKQNYYRSETGLAESDYGKYSKVVVSGSCHSRCMMMDSETDWAMLKLWAKAQSKLTSAHIALWKDKYQLINDMNNVIDQAKFLSDVEQFWTNVKDCVNLENNEISKELSIVSDDCKNRLSQAVNGIVIDKKPETVAIVATDNTNSVQDYLKSENINY